MSGRAIVLVGHGSHLNGNSSAPVHGLADRLRGSARFPEVGVAFWKEEPQLSRAFDALTATDVTVVPVFISTGYFVQEVIPREMRLSGRASVVDGRRVRYTAPVGAHPALAGVVAQRAREAGAGRGDAVAVLGHGTARNPNSEQNVFACARNVAGLGGFAEVTTVFLDQEPNMRDVFQLVRAETVVMVPLFIAEGWHVGETIPDDMALEGPETRRAGRRLRYTAPVGTHPAISDVVLELAEEAAGW